MKQHMQTMIDLLTSNDFDALLQHFSISSEPENIAQLAFLYLQGQKSIIKFGFYQQIATKWIDKKGLPLALISEFKSSDLLNFFTPVLQLEGNFNKTNDRQRNVLHYLLAGDQSRVTNVEPPFNYLRSMMLFERNESLCNALCQRDSQNFTPVEVYLYSNKNLSILATHELSALFALIEIESKQQVIDEANYQLITQNVAKICRSQVQLVNIELQRLLLIATYYKKPIQEIINDMNIIS
ncbi:hypothetical protein CXF85_01885 [Colwellia sp. 75C3]|uniref:hypothetical protein n=1 Tax=Colwellia sp. 75C3 TaxID=888425 RepID=UPI000C3367D7|nr:hypothetical protein [Colwellia sp. 75C3]PKG86479.1 hypothetical protein CXF85_01885 [Colwellia sp. 75C3]